MEFIISYILPLLIISVALILSLRTEILKDKCEGTLEKKPYSFARTQLMWWTLIIICTYIHYYGAFRMIQELNDTCLILLGISLGTTATARIIDNTDINRGLLRHQDTNESLGFFTDILSDENGISVHRFQALVFNFIFGVIFVIEYFQDSEFTVFGDTELTLMGISSAAYVGLKLNENQGENNRSDSQNTNPSKRRETTEEDLLDIDETYAQLNP